MVGLNILLTIFRSFISEALSIQYLYQCLWRFLKYNLDSIIQKWLYISCCFFRRYVEFLRFMYSKLINLLFRSIKESIYYYLYYLLSVSGTLYFNGSNSISDDNRRGFIQEWFSRHTRRRQPRQDCPSIRELQ